jgi:hypothetical protein
LILSSKWLAAKIAEMPLERRPEGFTVLGEVLLEAAKAMKFEGTKLDEFVNHTLSAVETLVSERDGGGGSGRKQLGARRIRTVLRIDPDHRALGAYRHHPWALFLARFRIGRAVAQPLRQPAGGSPPRQREEFWQASNP